MAKKDEITLKMLSRHCPRCEAPDFVVNSCSFDVEKWTELVHECHCSNCGTDFTITYKIEVKYTSTEAEELVKASEENDVTTEETIKRIIEAEFEWLKLQRE